MGAALTTQNAKSNLELRRRIDYIAKNFIFDSDFTDMTKLGNEKYCNRLMKNVSEIFKKNKNSVDIVLLRQKLYEIKKNKNDLDTFVEEDSSFARTLDKPIIPVPRVNANDNKDDNDKLSPRIQIERPQQQSQSQESIRTGGDKNIHNIKKKCNEIAKFYVLFAHLFSCIVSTINPSFEIDASSSSSSDKKSAGSLDFCSSRLNLLINDELIKNSEGDVRIKTNVCKTNLSESGTALRLVDLPGIKALLKLFKNSGDDSKEDLKYLYEALTGEKAPDDINIEHPLRIFNEDVECSGSGSSSSRSRSESRGGAFNDYQDDSYRYKDRDERDIRNLNVDVRTGIYLTGVIGNPTKEKLFSDYIKNIKIMIQKSEKNRSLLLKILSEMFTYTYDSDDEISGVIINPSLTFKDLQSLVRRTRKIIIKLYTECEEDYNEGLDIFFALIQEKILSKLTLQDDTLRRELEQSIYGKQERYIPVNPFQNPYQNPYQNQNPFQNSNQNSNKNQFVPPHFKQDVIKEFKQILKENDVDSNENELSQKFKISKPGLDAWIDQEIQYANGPEMLDASQVAHDFYETSINEEDVSDTVAPSPAAAPVAVGVNAAAAVNVAAAAAPAAPVAVIPLSSPKKKAKP